MKILISLLDAIWMLTLLVWSMKNAVAEASGLTFCNIFQGKNLIKHLIDLILISVLVCAGDRGYQFGLGIQTISYHRLDTG